jgi:hypothetical protein
MFDNFLKWRVANKVDTILDTFEFPEKAELDVCYPVGYHKTDK